MSDKGCGEAEVMNKGQSGRGRPEEVTFDPDPNNWEGALGRGRAVQRPWGRAGRHIGGWQEQGEGPQAQSIWSPVWQAFFRAQEEPRVSLSSGVQIWPHSLSWAQHHPDQGPSGQCCQGLSFRSHSLTAAVSRWEAHLLPTGPLWWPRCLLFSSVKRLLVPGTEGRRESLALGLSTYGLL